MKFKAGQLVQTRSIHQESLDNPKFDLFVQSCIHRHLDGDWGDTCAEDRTMNELALRNGDRLFSVYKSEEFGVIWLVTEADRSVTTALRPEDY